ncbi:MAG: hypothetical protein U9Q04_02250 [Campylobacterota bacterium]|nr:hypothetical protein [Campylobacterota bacterium]
MNFKNYFEKLSLIQKVEIYIISMIFYSLLFIYSDQLFVEEKKEILPKLDTSFNTKLKQLEQKIDKTTQGIVFVKIEQTLQLYNIKTKKIQFDKNNCSLDIEGKLSDIMNFLNYLSIHFNINTIKIHKEQNTIVSSLTLNTKYIYNEKRKIQNINNIPNPFSLKRSYTNYKNRTNFKINAILDNEVYINQNWYKTNDKIEGYVIKNISPNGISLENIKNKKLLYLEVHSTKNLWSQDG